MEFIEYFSDLKFYWPVLVGLILLYVYGLYHFNTPVYPLLAEKELSSEEEADNVMESHVAHLRTAAPPMFTVQRGRYRQHNRYYILGLWLFFLFFVFAPEQAMLVLSLFGGGNEIEEGAWSYDTDAIYLRSVLTLFALTGLMPSFPVLRDWDKKIIQFLHHRAQIPDDTLLTAEQLFKGEFCPSVQLEKEVKELLGATAFRRAKGEKFKGHLEGSWFKVNCLWKSIENLRRENRFRHFLRYFSDDIIATEKIFKKYYKKIDEYKEFETSCLPKTIGDIDKHLDNSSYDPEKIPQLSYNRNKLEFKIDSLFFRLCILSSLLVYATETEIDKINNRFNELGFSRRVVHLPKFDSDTLIQLGLFIFVVTVIPSGIYHIFTSGKAVDNVLVPSSFPQAVGWSLSGVLLQVIAISVAIFLKRSFIRWKIHNDQFQSQANRFTRNILISLVACAIAVVVSALLMPLLLDAEKVDWKFLCFALVPPVTAYFTAVYIDYILSQREVKIGLRISHVFTMLVVTVFATFLALAKDLTALPEDMWPFSIYACTTAVLIALVVALLFPKIYRRQFEEGLEIERLAVQAKARPIVNQPKVRAPKEEVV